MQPGALRALEFDRIVEAVTGFALTPMGAERLSQPAAVDRRAAGGAVAGGDHRDRAVHRRARRLPAARVERAAADPGRRWRSKDARSRRCGCWRCDVSRFDRRRPRRHPPRARIVSAARRRDQRRGVVQGRNRAGPREDRSVGRGRRSRQPRAAGDPRPAAQAEVAAAQHARVVPARQGDREVPAGSGRHRAQRPLRAGGARPSIAAAFPASCTARRPAAPACSSSRSAPSRSTTTSSRSRNRRPRKSGASCSR